MASCVLNNNWYSWRYPSTNKKAPSLPDLYFDLIVFLSVFCRCQYNTIVMSFVVDKSRHQYVTHFSSKGKSGMLPWECRISMSATYFNFSPSLGKYVFSVIEWRTAKAFGPSSWKQTLAKTISCPLLLVHDQSLLRLSSRPRNGCRMKLNY